MGMGFSSTPSQVWLSPHLNSFKFAGSEILARKHTDCIVDRANSDDKAVGLRDTSAGKIRNSYHSWRRFQSRNGHTIRSSRHSTDPHYRAHSDHFSHPLASLGDTCRASARCGVDLVFPKSSLTTGCVLVSRFVSWSRKGCQVSDFAQRSLRIPRTG